MLVEDQATTLWEQARSHRFCALTDIVYPFIGIPPPFALGLMTKAPSMQHNRPTIVVPTCVASNRVADKSLAP
jgi:hypothetical protein